MKMTRLRFLLVGAALLVGGCATDVANRYYATERYPEKAVQNVELLNSKPSRQFVVIADFQSRGETAERLREKAAKIGADAVIVTVVGGVYHRGEQWAGDDAYKGRTHDFAGHIVGTAIVYK